MLPHSAKVMEPSGLDFEYPVFLHFAVNTQRLTKGDNMIDKVKVGDRFVWQGMEVQIFEVHYEDIFERVSFFEIGNNFPMTYPIKSFLRDAKKIKCS